MAKTIKTSLLEELKGLLQKDDRFTAEGQLLKNTVVEHALKLDKDLIMLLLSTNRIKGHFFADIEGTLVFDKDKFIAFVDNKQFLPDSYTAFKINIGLTLDGKDDYLKERKDVVLVWPYKDCVLEGGQTKEDQKRDEIFWNEILAPDEIDRLFEPKVLTNFRRFDKNGEHKVTEIKDTDNIIIKGNNLLALNTLKKRFAGKVKLIYIDPPYNTGTDSFQYNDNFKNSTWLTFMKNRLEVAEQLLRANGVIFVQISDVNVAPLKLIMDEIFKGNFVNQITIKTRSASGFKTVNLGLFESAEYILCYAKDKAKVKIEPQYIEGSYDKQYKYMLLDRTSKPEKWIIKDIKDVVKKKITDILQDKNLSKNLKDKILTEEIEKFALENASLVFRLENIGNDAGKDTLKAKESSLKEPEKIFVVRREKYHDRFIHKGQ